MSVARVRWDLSIPAVQVWVIAVIVLVVLIWRPFGQAVGAVADATAVLGALISCGTAATYSNRSKRE